MSAYVMNATLLHMATTRRLTMSFMAKVASTSAEAINPISLLRVTICTPHQSFQLLHAQMKKFDYSSIRRVPVSNFQKHPVALHLAFGTCQSCVIQPLSYLAKEAEDFFSLSHEDCHSLSPIPFGLGPQIVAFEAGIGTVTDR
jgi:arginine deiminase